MTDGGGSAVEAGAGAAAPSLARAALVYSGLRLGLLVGLLALLLLVGVPALPAAVTALVGSAVGSLVLLRRQRDALTAALLARRERAQARRAHEQRVRDHVLQVRQDGSRPSAG
jgi:xanthosine utilization system XapX-like protein